MRHYLAGASALVAGAFLFIATPAAAQSSETWVSGVGSDANPCSRTSPCLTFTGALAQTSAGGQINCLDPGNFGDVTISESVTIDCDKGTIIETSSHAVTISAGASDTVTIRGVQIDGGLASTGNGIHYVSGGKVILDKVSIRNFLADGIDFRPAASVQLFITDSAITNNRSSIAGAGLLVIPTGTPTAVISLDNVSMNGNTSAGLRIKTASMTGGGVAVKVSGSSFNNNAFGMVVQAGAGTAPATVTVDSTELTRNTNHGLGASGPNAQILVSNSVITGNGMGAVGAASGTVISAGGNVLTSNSANGAFTSTVAQQ